MKITREEVLKVADLARLEIPEASIDRMAGQIGKILEYVATLNGVDTEQVVPTSHAVSMPTPFREDAEKGQLDREAATANAPETEDGNFAVPKIIGE
jgi:aspartyl-tRNA(Asn)/glutamyl-tRNA(Gln) amidotransferase subunit C